MTGPDSNPAAEPDIAELVRTTFGDLDPLVLARVVGTGATPAEIAEAYAWLNADDQVGRLRHRPPQGRVADIVEILQPEVEPPEDPGPVAPTGPT